MSELAPNGTAVGTILAAAINQTIFYSIVAGNELGLCNRSYDHQPNVIMYHLSAGAYLFFLVFPPVILSDTLI